MNDAAFLELLASYEAALDVAHRSMTIAQVLAEGHRDGVPPPDALIDAYLARADRDAAQLWALRQKWRSSNRCSGRIESGALKWHD